MADGRLERSGWKPPVFHLAEGQVSTKHLLWPGQALRRCLNPVVMGYWWPQNEFHHCSENKGIFEKIVEVEYQYLLDNRVILWSGIRNKLGLVYGPVDLFLWSLFV